MPIDIASTKNQGTPANSSSPMNAMYKHPSMNTVNIMRKVSSVSLP